MPTLTQTEHFSADAHDVFETLMDEHRHAELTGSPASIDRASGGSFSVWDGYATGITTETIPDRRIVQEWRASDWPEGVISHLTIDISPDNDGSRLTLTQEGIPDDYFSDIAEGWQEFYWEPLRERFS